MLNVLLYDMLTTDPALEAFMPEGANLTDQVMPRQSESIVPEIVPFVIFGLGNATNEQLADPTANDAEVYRQFFQVWIHDRGGSYNRINDMIPVIKRRLVGLRSPAHELVSIIWLENSQEFNNETYDTLFRYIRFQAVISRERVPS